MTENDKSWHEKDQEYVLKLMWHPYVNYLTFEMLKNYKNMPDCHYEINDEKWQKMTENDRKWHNKWLKMRQVIETKLKELKNSQKDSKWSKMTKMTECHHERKCQKMTNSDTKRSKNMF